MCCTSQKSGYQSSCLRLVRHGELYGLLVAVRVTWSHVEKHAKDKTDRKSFSRVLGEFVNARTSPLHKKVQAWSILEMGRSDRDEIG